jgi:hypothetical protein
MHIANDRLAITARCVTDGVFLAAAKLIHHMAQDRQTAVTSRSRDDAAAVEHQQTRVLVFLILPRHISSMIQSFIFRNQSCELSPSFAIEIDALLLL